MSGTRTTLVVLVPFGGDEDDRRPMLDRVTNHLGGFAGFELAEDDGLPFSRARAINRGIERNLDAGVIVLNDADTIVPHLQMEDAVEHAQAAPGLIWAFDEYLRLGQDGKPEWRMRGSGSTGCVAMQTACWLEVGGFDPRFEAWGYEDLALALVCDAHWPSRRVPGPLFHLWHPPAEGDPRWAVQEQANLDLYRRYQQAAGDKDRLLALRREAEWLNLIPA